MTYLYGGKKKGEKMEEKNKSPLKLNYCSTVYIHNTNKKITVRCFHYRPGRWCLDVK
jgi:hypothetical protein